MKQRMGFVSNSSSSSFVILVKNGKLTANKVLTAMNVGMESPLYHIAQKLATFMASTEEKNKTELLAEYGVTTITELSDVLQRGLTEGWRVYIGEASNNGDGPIQALLYNLSIQYEDGDIVIEAE